MVPSETPLWIPLDFHERRTGWTLHAYLSTLTLPDKQWDGTPAGAADQLYDLIEACAELWDDHLHRKGHGTLTSLLETAMSAARRTADRWRKDTTPLRPTDPVVANDDRAVELHSDLAGFADLCERLSTTLAIGGGWHGYGERGNLRRSREQ